jgi:hypothetical protein
MVAVVAAALEGLACMAGDAAQEPAERVRASISDAQAESLVDRTNEAALVVVARPTTVRNDNTADCRVISVLKAPAGAKGMSSFRVHFSKLHGGSWPERGVTAVYFLRPQEGGNTGYLPGRTAYELLSYKHGLAEPTESVIAVVKLAAEGKYVKASERGRTPLQLPAPETELGTLLSASYAALAVIEEVVLPDNREAAAILTCRLDEVFKGDLRKGQRISITVPALPQEAAPTGPDSVRPEITAGPALLMFVRRGQGGPFQLVSSKRGYFRLGNSHQTIAGKTREVLDLVRQEKELRENGLVGDPARRISVAATLRLWQESWSAREIENVLSCYSRRSKWFKQWESGSDGRRAIAQAIESYPATFHATLERLEELPEAPIAKASVTLNLLSRDRDAERRSVVMTFIHENGMWLILDEGN